MRERERERERGAVVDNMDNERGNKDRNKIKTGGRKTERGTEREKKRGSVLDKRQEE